MPKDADEETKFLYPCPICKGSRFNLTVPDGELFPSQIPCWACDGMGVVHIEQLVLDNTVQKV